MPLPKVRFISPASIRIGDTVRAVWKVKDVEHTRTGTVAKREYEGGMRVLYTRQGEELFRWHPAHDKEIRVTLLKEAVDTSQPTLFDVG